MSRSTLIAAFVFIALLGAVVVALQKPKSQGMTEISFADVDPEAIDSIVITGTKPVTLTKKDGSWQLGDGRPAAHKAVTALLDELVKVKSRTLVSRDSGRFGDLNVDEATGTHLVASAGGAIVAEFTLGNGKGGAANVRVGDEVYAVKGLRTYVFSRGDLQWHKLEVFDFDRNDVDRVDVALAGETAYSLTKTDNSWALADRSVVPEGFRFDQARGNTLATGLATLRVKAFVDEDPGVEKTGLGDAADKLMLHAGEKSVEVRLGKANDKGDVYIGANDEVYLINSYLADRLRKKVVDLRDLRMMNVVQANVTSLDIVDGKTRLSFAKEEALWTLVRSSEKQPDDFEFDPVQLTRRLALIANTRGVSWVDNPEDKVTRLNRPSSSLTMKVGENTVTLQFGAKNDGDSPPTIHARGNIPGTYLVPVTVRDNLFKGLDSFKKRAAPASPPQFDPSQLSGLPPEVRKQLMEQMQQGKGPFAPTN